MTVDVLDKKTNSLPKSQKLVREPEKVLNADVVKSTAVKSAIAEVVVPDSSQKVGPTGRAFPEYKFEITMPKPFLNYLRTQEEILSESSDERLLPQLPWQSKMATAAKILDLFLSKFADKEPCQKQDSTELGILPSYEVLKVSDIWL